MSKLFFQNYHYHYGKMKCFRNEDFEEIDTECSTEKMVHFEYCEEYLRSTPNKILLWQCCEKQILIQLSFAN